MGTVTLRSKVNTVEFTRRTMLRHESGNQYLAPVTYRFCLDNNFTSTVPSQVWEELRDEYLDRTHDLRYREAFQVL